MLLAAVYAAAEGVSVWGMLFTRVLAGVAVLPGMKLGKAAAFERLFSHNPLGRAAAQVTPGMFVTRRLDLRDCVGVTACSLHYSPL